VVTFTLLWIMQFLIATGIDAVTEKRDFKFLDFVRVKETEQLMVEKAKPKKPPEPETPPPDMPPPQADTFDSAGASFGVPDLSGVDINIGMGGSFDNMDGEYLPVVKVNPIYPRRAQQRGLSGYCDVRFTVTRLGTVEDVEIIECSSSLFERASINAARKFKYKPRVVDGEPIDTPGVPHRISFEIEE